MNRIVRILLSLIIFISCNTDEINVPIPEDDNPKFISAVDISGYPEISHTNPVFYDFF